MKQIITNIHCVLRLTLGENKIIKGIITKALVCKQLLAQGQEYKH